jgi:Putative Actinobacterial Holin-X, holin superfamily III
MQPALPLFLDLLRQVRDLFAVELKLAQAELRERGSVLPSSLTAVVVGLVLLPVGAILLFVAVSLFLMRLGAPLDLSFLIVALVLLAGGFLALRWGASRLKPSRLAPTKSISQISSLLGEF